MAGLQGCRYYNAALVREKISRQNNFKQEGETYRNFEEWEREELILNLGNTLASARKEIQDKMIENLTQCDPDYGKRVAESIWKAASMMPDKGPIGSTESNKAVKEAEEVSREARPY